MWFKSVKEYFEDVYSYLNGILGFKREVRVRDIFLWG